MGAEKGNEGSGGTEGRGGSDKPRQSFVSLKNNLLTKHFYLLLFFNGERKNIRCSLYVHLTSQRAHMESASHLIFFFLCHGRTDIAKIN